MDIDMDMNNQNYTANNGMTLLIETTAAEFRDDGQTRDWGDETRGPVSAFVRKTKDEAVDAAFDTIEHLAQQSSSQRCRNRAITRCLPASTSSLG